MCTYIPRLLRAALGELGLTGGQVGIAAIPPSGR